MAVPTLSNNVPSAGNIQWGAFNIQYNGVSYAIASGSTSARWVWWRYNGGSAVIEAGADIPATLGADDLLLFGNKNGIGVRMQSANLIDGELLVDGSIFSEALSTNLINSNHIVTAGLDAGVVKFGTMSGDRISANTIVAEKLAIASVADNSALNGDFAITSPTDSTLPQYFATGGWPAGTASPSTIGLDATVFETGTRSVKMTTLVAGTNPSPSFRTDTAIPVVAGETWVIDIRAKASATMSGLYVRLMNQNGVESNQTIENRTVTTNWATFGGSFVIPSGMTTMRVFVLKYNSALNTSLWVDSISIRKVGVSLRVADGTVSASKIVTEGLDAGVIKFGTMSGERIAAKTITTEQLTVGSLGDNLVLNGNFQDYTQVTGGGYYNNNKAVGWTRNEGLYGGGVNTHTEYPGGVALVILRNSAGYGHIASDPFTVTSGDSIAVTCRAGYVGQVPSFYFRVVWLNGTKAFTGYSDVTAVDPLTGYAGDNNRKLISGAFVVPTNARYARIEMFNHPAGGSDSYVLVNDVAARRVIVSAHIADGAITTPKIVAGAINSQHVVTAGLDAGVIKFGAMHGDRITANTLNADRIVANTLQAAIVNAGAINGITMTSTTVKTSATGNRLELAEDAAGGEIRFFTGDPNEATSYGYGYVNPYVDSGRPGIRIQTPKFNTSSGSTNGDRASLELTGKSPTGSSPARIHLSALGTGGMVTLAAEKVLITGRLHKGSNPLLQSVDSFASSQITVTATSLAAAQAIPGCSVWLPLDGTDDIYEVDVVMDIQTVTGSSAVLVGVLRYTDGVGATTTLDRSLIYQSPTSGTRATVSQKWRITGVNSGGSTPKITPTLYVYKTSTAGTHLVQTTHTIINMKRIT